MSSVPHKAHQASSQRLALANLRKRKSTSPASEGVKLKKARASPPSDSGSITERPARGPTTHGSLPAEPPDEADDESEQFSNNLKLLRDFVECERARVICKSNLEAANRAYENRLKGVQEARAYFRHLQKKPAEGHETILEAVAAEAVHGQQRVVRYKESLAVTRRSLEGCLQWREELRQSFFLKARKLLKTDLDGREGRPKFTMDFRQALRTAVEGWELLEEEEIELPTHIWSHQQAVSNTGDTHLQPSGWRTYARRHSAPSVIASVVSAEALVSDLEDKELAAQEAVDDLEQTLPIYRAQQWEREIKFLKSFADPLLAEHGLLKAIPAPINAGTTTRINNPGLERERVTAEGNLRERRQRLEDLRTYYTNNLDRALMSRLRTTKQGFDESYF